MSGTVFQYELNQIYKPPDFNIAEAYAKLLHTISLTSMFGPALPMAYTLTFVAILLMYFR